MSETPLTRQRILDAAEETLRRFGPSKATVVDVAKALGVSHGSVYKHFGSKAELREAVTRLWLERVDDPLRQIVAEDGPAGDRLHRWLKQLIIIKRSRATEDPELFATYVVLAREAREVVKQHIEELTGQVTTIIEDGVKRGEFHVTAPMASAQAILAATTKYHHPAHSSEWENEGVDAAFEDLWALLLKGLQA